MTGDEVLTTQETPRRTTSTARESYWQHQYNVIQTAGNWVTETGTGIAAGFSVIDNDNVECDNWRNCQVLSQIKYTAQQYISHLIQKQET